MAHAGCALQSPACAAKSKPVTFGTPVVLAILALVAVVSYWLAAHYFSGNAKWERRRRRSNSPVVSKRRGPAVKFSVRTRKSRKR